MPDVETRCGRTHLTRLNTLAPVEGKFVAAATFVSRASKRASRTWRIECGEHNLRLSLALSRRKQGFESPRERQ
jgi:hypothetical protein